MKIALITARFNKQITEKLYSSAKEVFEKHSVDLIEESVPGAFELPLTAKKMVEKFDVDAVLVLGAVIKGETAHFEYVSRGVADGIMQVMLEVNKPIIFGVLTTYTREQAEARLSLGAEWAESAIEMSKKINSRNS